MPKLSEYEIEAKRLARMERWVNQLQTAASFEALNAAAAADPRRADPRFYREPAPFTTSNLVAESCALTGQNPDELLKAIAENMKEETAPDWYRLPGRHSRLDSDR